MADFIIDRDIQAEFAHRQPPDCRLQEIAGHHIITLGADQIHTDIEKLLFGVEHIEDGARADKIGRASCRERV